MQAQVVADWSPAASSDLKGVSLLLLLWCFVVVVVRVFFLLLGCFVVVVKMFSFCYVCCWLVVRSLL